MAHHRGGSLSGFSQQQCDRAARRDWSHLLRVSERLQGARIRCQDFRKSFAQAVTDSMIYLDPPYLDGGQYYQHTMSEQDHHDMLTLAKRHDGPVAISGYDSELYLEQLHGWRRVEFVSQNAQREKRTEVLWMNYP
jgi:DNA adenine methylase